MAVQVNHGQVLVMVTWDNSYKLKIYSDFKKVIRLGVEVMNNKVSLKKINKANYSTVRTLKCHCGCEGKPVTAYMHSYIGQFL